VVYECEEKNGRKKSHQATQSKTEEVWGDDKHRQEGRKSPAVLLFAGWRLPWLLGVGLSW